MLNLMDPFSCTLHACHVTCSCTQSNDFMRFGLLAFLDKNGRFWGKFSSANGWLHDAGLFFSSWVKMTVLKSLHMGQCTKLTAEGLACAASNFSSLHFLNVDRCTRAVMAINMSTLRKLPYLTELSARNVKCLRRTWDLSGKSTISKSYAAHTRLTKITLKGSYGYGEAGSASLISLVNTRHLDIDCCDMELFKSGESPN